jgi:hypothetical protein
MVKAECASGKEVQGEAPWEYGRGSRKPSGQLSLLGQIFSSPTIHIVRTRFFTDEFQGMMPVLGAKMLRLLV